MNYIARFDLEFNPFIKNSKEVIYESEDFKELEFRLKYLETVKGFGLITASAGCGKTTFIRRWSNNLNKSLYRIVYLSLSTLTVLEFYRALAVELGCEARYRKSENYKVIQEAINRLVFEKKITPVIILDEANYLINSILNDLKMLFNFEMDSKDRAIVLLVGLPTLNNTLLLTANEPLKQRIIMNYHLEPLNKLASKDYILKKLTDAGCHKSIIHESCFEAIANYSNGLPRIINKIMNASLLLANSLDSAEISNDIVMKTINDITLG